ncbi:VOC family protein [Nonomuraea basaltis]|uniref:VOC family protein n=1 Tax=Nonomuraea basaltis TaxID=2495887 RepID=UPI00110C491D|nr:VOC family protein [Nonomuraea basaltis]TMR98780.1 MerR family transcriptional regulator [Nonomuraea basaltis]
MSSDNFLSIGVFALVSGLSIHALRHYDELGLLRPAIVDPVTGYRRYRPEQVRQARLICALRRVDVPIDSVRVVLDDQDGESLRTVLYQHRKRLVDRAQVLSRMVRTVDHYIEHGVAMPDLKTPRIVQVTINVTDLAESISFYQAAFDAVFNEEISSFQFGTWPSEEFFLLTVAHEPNEHGKHEGPAGVSRFGLLVDDVDAAHHRAVDAGAIEVFPPADKPWKPRSSCVTDPSGNRIDLYQA